MRPVTTSKPLMVRCSLTFSFWTPNCLLSVFIVRSYRTSHVWITCTPCKKLINYIPSQIKDANQAMRHTPKNIFRFHFPPIFIIEVISFVRLKMESTNCAHDAIIDLARFSQMVLWELDSHFGVYVNAILIFKAQGRSAMIWPDHISVLISAAPAYAVYYWIIGHQ